MRFGPGAMVAAAFIGPGTLTTAATAGASTGVALLWAVAFSIFATWVLQGLVVSVSLATDRDLAQLIRDRQAESKIWLVMASLVILAIGFGNAAYQSGNIAGAAVGLGVLLPLPKMAIVLALASLAGLLIALNNYRLIERVLVLLVALMAAIFVGLALWLLPEVWNTGRMTTGVDVADDGNLKLVLALIGTTVVPYNLFLHSRAVLERRCSQPEEPTEALQRESTAAIVVGGVITVAVVIVAAALLTSEDARQALPALATALENKVPGGKYLLALGLLGAGLTSAIAAPVAAGWAVCGVMGWSTHRSARGFKAVAMLVLCTGTFFAAFADRPSVLIVTAQAANALLLPIVAFTMILLARRYLNPQQKWLIVPGVLITLFVLALSLYRLNGLFS